MGSIINRSNHPVSIKRIGLKVWTLRDEIERAVAQRLKESRENGIEPDISDLQKFYGRGPNVQTNADIEQNSGEGYQDQDQNEGLDTAGNPMDEDAADMMAAMQGTDESEEIEDSSEESAESEEDDEAAAMALAMLADQGIAPDQENESTNAINKENSITRCLPHKDKISDGFLLVSDINMDYVLFFSKHSYLQGQTVALEFQIPQKFIITCEVLKAEDIDRVSKIISTTKPNYRIQALLTYNQPGERSNLREFLKSIEPEIPPPPSKLKRPQGDSEDDDDEFEDLGF